MTVVAPPPRRKNTGILIGSAVAVIVVVLVLGWLFLIGMPFGRPETLQRTQTVVSPATVGEETGPIGTPDLGVTNPPTAPPPTQTAAPLPPPIASPAPLPPPIPPPAPSTATTPLTPPPPPPPTPAPAADEITEEQAVEVLRGYTRDFYPDVERSCLGITSHGYVNVGYTLEVVDRCAGTSLGNWRVDSKTREVFKQNANGRYERP